MKNETETLLTSFQFLTVSPFNLSLPISSSNMERTSSTQAAANQEKLDELPLRLNPEIENDALTALSNGEKSDSSKHGHGNETPGDGQVDDHNENLDLVNKPG